MTEKCDTVKHVTISTSNEAYVSCLVISVIECW